MNNVKGFLHATLGSVYSSLFRKLVWLFSSVWQYFFHYVHTLVPSCRFFSLTRIHKPQYCFLWWFLMESDWHQHEDQTLLCSFSALWLQIFVNIRRSNNKILSRGNYSKYEHVLMKSTWQLLREICFTGTASPLERISSRR